jgi:hypothetical protein
MTSARIMAGLALLAAASMPGSPAAAAKKGAGAEDPDRQICKSRSVIGSRLKRIRECHSAAEWEDHELQERMGLRRQQFNGDPGCAEAVGCHLRPGSKDSPL